MRCIRTKRIYSLLLFPRRTSIHALRLAGVLPKASLLLIIYACRFWRSNGISYILRTYSLLCFRSSSLCRPSSNSGTVAFETGSYKLNYTRWLSKLCCQHWVFIDLHWLKSDLAQHMKFTLQRLPISCELVQRDYPKLFWPHTRRCEMLAGVPAMLHSWERHRRTEYEFTSPFRVFIAPRVGGVFGISLGFDFN